VVPLLFGDSVEYASRMENGISFDRRLDAVSKDAWTCGAT
jgi:hypothetical protein